MNCNDIFPWSQEKAHALQSRPKIVSLDLHDETVRVFIVDIRTGEILCDTNIIGGYRKCRRAIERAGTKNEMSIIMEAGPLGFGPYRYFTANGYEAKVVVPSSIPHRANEQKTDKADARKNLYYHVSGLLRYVHVPQRCDEDAREALRYRCQIVWRITKSKQQITSLVKRQGLRYTLTKSTWTKAHRKWLHDVAVSQPVRLVMDTVIDDMERLEKQKEDFDRTLGELVVAEPRYQRFYTAYRLIPGVGWVGALTLVLEGGDLGRFAHPKALMNYIGVVPKKEASGKSDPAMRITKAGNKYLRTALVCASKMYRDTRFGICKDRLAAACEPVKAFIEKLQDRLFSRYRHLIRRSKGSGKTMVAVARELCGFVWELATKVLPGVSEEQLLLSAKAIGG